jgi:HTH-type transcriptional regulator/antitoxin MqsA
MITNTDKCPSCGHNGLIDKVQEETLTYGGKSMTLHDMHGKFCPECGEGIWDEVSYRRFTEAQEGLVRAIKGDASADIRRIRRKLNLTQAQLALSFGIGKIAFSRYERGESKPPAPVLKLLKLIDRHPDLLNEIQQM